MRTKDFKWVLKIKIMTIFFVFYFSTWGNQASFFCRTLFMGLFNLFYESLSKKKGKINGKSLH